MGRPRNEHRIIDGVELKQCGTCKIWFPLDCFGPDRSKWDHLQYRHRQCGRKAVAESRGVVPSRISGPRTGKYSVAAWGTKAAARAAWRRDHPERDRAARKRSDAKNREAIRARDRARRPAGCEEVKELNRRRYQADRARVIAQVTLWRKNNPEWAAENGRLASNKRRARRRGLPTESWTDQQVIDRDGLACWICGLAVGGTLPSGRRDWAIDHLIPISANYLDHPGDTLPNLAIACHPCNITKGAKLLVPAVARYRTNLRRQLPKGDNNGDVQPAGRDARGREGSRGARGA